MKLNIGVMLSVICYLSHPAALGYPLSDTQSDSVSDSNSYPSHHLPMFGGPSDYAPVPERDRLSQLIISYFDLVGLKNHLLINGGDRLDDSDSKSYPELSDGSERLDTIIDEDALGEVEVGEKTDDRSKRQQGWYINYGKRSGGLPEDFSSSPSVYDELDQAVNEEVEDENQDLSRNADDYADAEMLLSAIASKFRSSRNNLPQMPSAQDFGKFRFADSWSPRGSAGLRFAKRQQGFHIGYGKRSKDGDQAENTFLL